MKRLRKKLRLRNPGEKGTILIWYVMMFPVLLAFAAIAIDTSMIYSTRTQLQASLDAATQSTTAMSQNQEGGTPQLSQNEARDLVLRLYDANRTGLYDNRNTTQIPFLQCQESPVRGGTLVVVNTGSGCGFTLSEFRYSPTGSLANGGYLTVTVQEKAETIFLHVLGFDDLTYTITSTSRLTESFN